MQFQTNRPPSWQTCIACGNETPELDPRPRCAICGGLLEVRHRPPNVTREELLQKFTERRGQRPGTPASGVWRFREVVMPSATDVVTYPEGNTPLLNRPALDQWTGMLRLLIKHEGHNPTGSFKDRGMTVGVTQACRVGAAAVACASTGNTSASLAAYASQAGIPALVFVPKDGVSMGKLAQSLAYGARTLLVRGDFDACLRLVEAASARLGVYLLNSINPLRLEGQKTIVLEMLQQLGWDAPDWIVLPAGNLGNTAAFGKALREAKEWGLITRVPRLAAVQAAGAAPFARSFEEGFATAAHVKAETVATAVRIGEPGVLRSRGDRDPGDERRRAGGVRLGDHGGEGGGGWLRSRLRAGERSGRRGCAGAGPQGLMDPSERVVAVLTGHVLKDPGVLLEYHKETEPPPPGANRPVEIEPIWRRWSGDG